MTKAAAMMPYIPFVESLWRMLAARGNVPHWGGVWDISEWCCCTDSLFEYLNVTEIVSCMNIQLFSQNTLHDSRQLPQSLLEYRHQVQIFFVVVSNFFYSFHSSNMKCQQTVFSYIQWCKEGFQLPGFIDCALFLVYLIIHNYLSSSASPLGQPSPSSPPHYATGYISDSTDLTYRRKYWVSKVETYFVKSFWALSRLEMLSENGPRLGCFCFQEHNHMTTMSLMITY